MKMRYFETRRARIEIIPMIDIMLFLLVFFAIVTLHMIPASGVRTRLPRSTTSQPIPHPDVVVSLASDGSITVDHKTLTLAQLTARLKSARPGKMRVTIAGAGKASLQSLMNVMDACRKAGVTRIGLAARPGSPSADGA